MIPITRFGHGDYRYLSPEPLLQEPDWVAGQLRSGHQVPTYSYARNNPIAYSDSTGLYASGKPYPENPAEVTATAAVFSHPVTAALAIGFGLGFGASQLVPPFMSSGPSPTPSPAPVPAPSPTPPPAPNPSCGGNWRQCVDRYRQDIQVCKDILTNKGLSTSNAKAVCQSCLNDSLFACQSGGPRPSAPSADCVRNLGYYGLTGADITSLF